VVGESASSSELWCKIFLLLVIMRVGLGQIGFKYCVSPLCVGISMCATSCGRATFLCVASQPQATATPQKNSIQAHTQTTTPLTHSELEEEAKTLSSATRSTTSTSPTCTLSLIQSNSDSEDWDEVALGEKVYL